MGHRAIGHAGILIGQFFTSPALSSLDWKAKLHTPGLELLSRWFGKVERSRVQIGDWKTPQAAHIIQLDRLAADNGISGFFFSRSPQSQKCIDELFRYIFHFRWPNARGWKSSVKLQLHSFFTCRCFRGREQSAHYASETRTHTSQDRKESSQQRRARAWLIAAQYYAKKANTFVRAWDFI